MYSLVKKIIPGFIKSLFWQKYLRIRFASSSYLGKNIVLSKDLVIGINCRISDNVIFGRSVKLGDNVSIGKGTFLENIEVGKDSLIEGGVVCTGHGKGKIKIGQNSYIGVYNILDWSDDLTIGNFVHIAGSSTGLWTHSSAPMCMKSIPLSERNREVRPTAPIIVEDNVYIGGNCTVYPGIKISHHSIVAPNSAVTKNVESHTMVGGVPAKEIQKLK